MHALIIGYGSAGKRHGQLLDDLGVEWRAYDPLANRMDDSRITNSAFGMLLDDLQRDTLLVDTFDFIVICSPPDTHLPYIKRAVELSIPVLCEKPLCEWGQLNKARELPNDAQIMMAFNYRFHPTWAYVRGAILNFPSSANDWAFLCDQVRKDIPEWGMLLENLSHTFDLMAWLSSGEIPKVHAAHFSNKASCTVTTVSGSLGPKRFSIWDKVAIGSKNIKRFSGVLCPTGFVEPNRDYDWQMYLNMYDYFLRSIEGGTRFEPSLGDGIAAQKLLEDTRALSKTN